MSPIMLLSLAAAGLSAGMAAWTFFRVMPTRWLLDYGEIEISDQLKQSQQLSFWPGAVLIMLAQALLFMLTGLSIGFGLYWFLIILSCQPLILVMIADQRTRIIPDQFVVFLIPCALALWIYDSFSGYSGWLQGLGHRLLAGIAGALFLWLSGWLAQKIMHREAMGMGDVKLLFAVGLLVSLRQLPLLVILSFITAAFLAVPLLIRRLRNPDSDTEMAFGPFIALAAILVMGFQTQVNQIWQMYLNLLS